MSGFMSMIKLVLLLAVLLLLSPSMAQEAIVDGQEEEVVFEDEDELDEAEVATVAPEHEYSGWLLSLPLLGVGLLALNVRWRKPSPEGK